MELRTVLDLLQHYPRRWIDRTKKTDIAALAVGEEANLCLVDLDASFEVGAAGYLSRSANCCYHGQTLYKRVLLTIAAGSVAHRARLLAQAPALV